MWRSLLTFVMMRAYVVSLSRSFSSRSMNVSLFVLTWNLSFVQRTPDTLYAQPHNSLQPCDPECRRPQNSINLLLPSNQQHPTSSSQALTHARDHHHYHHHHRHQPLINSALQYNRRLIHWNLKTARNTERLDRDEVVLWCMTRVVTDLLKQSGATPAFFFGTEHQLNLPQMHIRC